MSGFFNKLLGKNKGSDNTSDADSLAENENSDGLWTEHEVSHDIEATGATPILAPEAASNENPSDQNPEQLSTDQDTKQDQLKSPSEHPLSPNVTEPDTVGAGSEIASIPSEDLIKAADFVIDPLDDITAQIQAELAEEKRVKAKQEQRRRILEATDQFRRPDWKDDILKPDD